MIKEIWKPVKGFESLYEVSSFGNVRSLPRMARRRSGTDNNHLYLYAGKILKPYVNYKGYLWVRLYNDGKTTDKSVHRLVLEAFVENSLGYEQINHKDENKKNNHVENLEWCSNKYNRNYGSCAYRFCKPVVQINKVTFDVIKKYKSATHAQRETGIAQANISRNCVGRCKSAGGYIWHFL